jgi:predicted anti-sigma-YlaC factor YlaD
MRHATKHFQAWTEERLDREAQRLIEIHLEDCAECRAYFERMSQLLEKPEESDLPRLEPDPFLPGRIRGLAEKSSETAHADWPARLGLMRPVGWLRLSYYGFLFAVAVAAGVYFGQSAAARGLMGNGDGQLLTGYYEAFSQSGFADDWEQLLDTESKEL